MTASFDLQALYEALDEQRRFRELTWTAVAREVSRSRTGNLPVAVSTITGLKERRVAEGDGILQMLLWLRRAPESFVSGFEAVDAERFQLPDPGPERVLRWDTRALHLALDTRRQERGLTWREAAVEIGGWTPAMLSNLAKGGRGSFPGVMRPVCWLERPAAEFTRASDW